jgi:2-aminoadipate transaminase
MPGSPFYIDTGGDDTIRLNFSAPDLDQIAEGMERLSKVVRNI